MSPLFTTQPFKISRSPALALQSSASPAGVPPDPCWGSEPPTAAGVKALGWLLRQSWQPLQILHINGGAHGNQMLNVVQQGKKSSFSLPLRGWLMLTLIHNYKTRTRSQVHPLIFKPCATRTETPPPTLPSCPRGALPRCSGVTPCCCFFSLRHTWPLQIEISHCPSPSDGGS